MTSKTPNTFVVGAGPVATALAGGLRLAGVPVLGLWARRPAAARGAGAATGVAAFSAAPPDLLLEADVVVLAVRDDAIAQVARTLVATGLVNRHHSILHCSGGSSAVEILAGVRAEVGGVGTMHPLRAIPDGRAAMRTLKGTVFGVEGDERGRRDAQLLVQALGGRPLELDGRAMAAYHAAAVTASNFLVALVDAAVELFADVGVGEADALAALLPLTEGALINLREHGLVEGLTGPIRRGDAATIARHMEVLAGRPELAEIYRLLGRRLVALARRREGADPAVLDAIDRGFEAGSPERLSGARERKIL